MVKCIVCDSPATVQCVCGKCVAYCDEHLHLFEGDNFVCRALVGLEQEKKELQL